MATYENIVGVVVVEAVVIQHGLLCDVLELRELALLELILSEVKEEWFVDGDIADG